MNLYRGKIIGVVVPAYTEWLLIRETSTRFVLNSIMVIAIFDKLKKI